MSNDLTILQDILSAILKLPIDTLLIGKVTKVYSKHFYLFYSSPQHYWAVFLTTLQQYKSSPDRYSSILATVLQAMCYQGDVITNVSCTAICGIVI